MRIQGTALAVGALAVGGCSLVLSPSRHQQGSTGEDAMTDAGAPIDGAVGSEDAAVDGSGPEADAGPASCAEAPCDGKAYCSPERLCLPGFVVNIASFDGEVPVDADVTGFTSTGGPIPFAVDRTVDGLGQVVLPLEGGRVQVKVRSHTFEFWGLDRELTIRLPAPPPTMHDGVALPRGPEEALLSNACGGRLAPQCALGDGRFLGYLSPDRWFTIAGGVAEPMVTEGGRTLTLPGVGDHDLGYGIALPARLHRGDARVGPVHVPADAPVAVFASRSREPGLIGVVVLPSSGSAGWTPRTPGDLSLPTTTGGGVTTPAAATYVEFTRDNKTLVVPGGLTVPGPLINHSVRVVRYVGGDGTSTLPYIEVMPRYGTPYLPGDLLDIVEGST